VGPLALTCYVAWLVFTTVDRWLGLPVPGVGFVLTVALITLVGFLASNLLTRSVVAIIERVVQRLPFARLLYTSTRDLLNAFVGERRRFDIPVLVSLAENSDVKALGFVTQESLSGFGVEHHVAVYLPQSYNFAGNLLIVPANRIARVKAESAEVMAFIVSGGVTNSQWRGDS